MNAAFLNGKLDEEIYVDRLKGFAIPRQESKVCKLLKPLYGLKQEPKQCHEKFHNTLRWTCFVVNKAGKLMCVLPIWWRQRSDYILIC